MEKIFHDIYVRNLWGDAESVSGPGSSLARTSAFRAELPPLFEALRARILLDAPCGDFNWMKEVELKVEHYFGVDIVSELIEQNQRHYGNSRRTFLRLDLTQDQLPYADVILCRDCLVHFSFTDACAALRNFKRSQAVYLLATTFTGVVENVDIATGGWRAINLQQPPLNFPPPLRLIDEKRRIPDGLYAGKCLALWKLEDIAV